MRILTIIFLVAVLIINFGCAPTPKPIITKTEKTIIPQEIPAEQYIEVDVKKLSNAAMSENYKNKYVMFDTNFLTINPYSEGLGYGKYKTGWVVFTVSSGSSFMGVPLGMSCLMPKEKADILFDLHQNQLIKVFGKVIIFSSFSTCFVNIEVHKIEVLSDAPNEKTQSNPLLDYAKQMPDQSK